jgi:hypothetical protein
VVTVLPRAAAPADLQASRLGGTGGPPLWAAGLGLALVGIGAGSVRLARRRAQNIDIAPGQA